jgi:hypothetical protein
MLIDMGDNYVITTLSKRDRVHASVNDRCYEKDTSKVEHNLSYARQINNSSACLSASTAQKMLQRFLVEEKTPKEKLAKVLGIKNSDLEKLLMKKGSLKLMVRINLPLIRVYCRTQWVEDE